MGFMDDFTEPGMNSRAELHFNRRNIKTLVIRLQTGTVWLIGCGHMYCAETSIRSSQPYRGHLFERRLPHIVIT